MKRCVIIAARPISVQMRDYIRNNDFIIAVDDGYLNARKLCVNPDLIIGDFDGSFTPQAGTLNVISLPAEKDETDTFAAAQIVVERKFDEVIILGGIGGRLDHTIANMHTLVYLAQHDIFAVLADEYNEIQVLINSSTEIIPKNDFALSLYPIGDKASGVTAKYVKYPLENAELTNNFPLGTSNEFRYSNAFIEVKNGGLYIIKSCTE